MLRRLRLENFKSFAQAKLDLGDFTALIGANASGKSNVRDALRFIHGVSRGYALAEVIGEKWIEGGVLQWRGVRGGSRQIVRHGSDDFSVGLDFTYTDGRATRNAHYGIRVSVDRTDLVPRVIGERLTLTDKDAYVFDTHPGGVALSVADPRHLTARVRKWRERGAPPHLQFLAHQPVLSQLSAHPEVPEWASRNASAAMAALGSMRFLDLSPEAARQPSPAGITTLGDRGENLSSVLQAIARDDAMRFELAGWVAQLTPMDAKDFTFESDASGRVLAVLVEEDGRETPLTTASDGTVRFLATIAALMGPDRSRFSFFEEIENGVHPNRLHLLLELIESSVERTGVQVLATTHSPYLLLQLNTANRESAALCYRSSEGSSGIVGLSDLPDAARVLVEHDPAQLMAAGWFEDTVGFADLRPTPGGPAAGAA